MTDQAVIQGVFADLKTVKTRSVIQVVVEVPIEQGSMIVDAFGFPQPGAEIPVAVARLDLAATPVKESMAFHSMDRTRQAGIKCNDLDFQKWLEVDDPEQAAMEVRRLCGVESRADLNTNEEAAAKWDIVLSRFVSDTTGRR